MKELLMILLIAVLAIKSWGVLSEYYAGPTETTIAIGEP
jgi:hypothetical protein